MYRTSTSTFRLQEDKYSGWSESTRTSQNMRETEKARTWERQKKQRPLLDEMAHFHAESQGSCGKRPRIPMATTSRVFCTCELRWGALQKAEGWDAFKARMRREPKEDDALFWTLPAYKGDKPRPLAYHAHWARIGMIGRAARDRGIIQRRLGLGRHGLEGSTGIDAARLP